MALSWVELKAVPYVIAEGADQVIVGVAGVDEELLPPLQPFNKEKT